ncbi:MAG: glycolate oxidase subunit GlcF [Methylobacter sp.]
MQTQLADFINNTDTGTEADAILRSCVHCGFCNATCPTYQLLGDELDGPRGRIYLIKHLLEGETATADTQLHLDRCLTCRSCETTCPSGVNYSRLLDIGRGILAERISRPWQQRLLRRLLLLGLPYPRRFAMLISIGARIRPLLPQRLQAKLPPRQAVESWSAGRHERRMLILQGCVQPSLAPRINAAAAKVLDRFGICLLPIDNCCGALSYHLDDQSSGLDMMRRIIDDCWPYVESGIEAIVTTASGCGVTVKDYGLLLKDDPLYADKAARIAALTKDISEVVQGEDLSILQPPSTKVAFHSPCTLQHGQRLDGVVENLLARLGFTLTAVAGSHLCCGSAGTYSILQPELAGRLQAAKIQALQAEQPDLIATANIGCWLHLQEKASVPVVHWIELLASCLEA